jgi:hypothetical protein
MASQEVEEKNPGNQTIDRTANYNEISKSDTYYDIKHKAPILPGYRRVRVLNWLNKSSLPL